MVGVAANATSATANVVGGPGYDACRNKLSLALSKIAKGEVFAPT
jgi:hypothetical protein